MDEHPELDAKGFTATLMPGQIAPALFQALPDVIFWIKDAEGRFVYVNQAFCHEVAKMSEDEVLGLKDGDIFPPTLAKVFLRGDQRVLKSRKPKLNKPELLPNRMGGVEWRSTSKIPLQDLEGNWVGTAGISRKTGYSEQLPTSGGQRKLSVIVAAIHDNLQHQVSITSLAQAASISVSTLERLFREHMDTTPRQFILQVKMSAACDWLMNTEMQVREVANALGYEEHANFTRAFTKLMGMSPRAYQEFYKKS
ncbi:AraC family transcriptional regulator [Verrucomicrobiaceae bacterium R5-34]|uniref:AraC family transcriptional regulator n=1 Tax=Oceaniferula flava TaxID=2800421 RepID=A0AAE2VEJ1_9BACT|nr:AraC family transcriptional regulator [Oceaniferula flavus]MBK1830639.1 AraC family transcriptional regulator [Verrucomicrobiaceae bacterium R5-34]MBK1855899.1 AraC family transcriptional regulator [Oceaniferula flavus]MBM1137206.1 AraC family transcriptional regulator [Oceaniferula flavus]